MISSTASSFTGVRPVVKLLVFYFVQKKRRSFPWNKKQMLFWKMKRRARSCANTPCPASSRFWLRRCITSLTTRQGAGLNPDFAASRNCLRRGARPSASPLFRAGRPALFLPHRRRADAHHRRRHHPPHISRADLTLSRRPPVRNMLWYPDERRAAEFF